MEALETDIAVHMDPTVTPRRWLSAGDRVQYDTIHEMKEVKHKDLNLEMMTTLLDLERKGEKERARSLQGLFEKREAEMKKIKAKPLALPTIKVAKTPDQERQLIKNNPLATVLADMVTIICGEKQEGETAEIKRRLGDLQLSTVLQDTLEIQKAAIQGDLNLRNLPQILRQIPVPEFGQNENIVAEVETDYKLLKSIYFSGQELSSNCQIEVLLDGLREIIEKSKLNEKASIELLLRHLRGEAHTMVAGLKDQDISAEKIWEIVNSVYGVQIDAEGAQADFQQLCKNPQSSLVSNLNQIYLLASKSGLFDNHDTNGSSGVLTLALSWAAYWMKHFYKENDVDFLRQNIMEFEKTHQASKSSEIYAHYVAYARKRLGDQVPQKKFQVRNIDALSQLPKPVTGSAFPGNFHVQGVAGAHIRSQGGQQQYIGQERTWPRRQEEERERVFRCLACWCTENDLNGQGHAVSRCPFFPPHLRPKYGNYTTHQPCCNGFHKPLPFNQPCPSPRSTNRNYAQVTARPAFSRNQGHDAERPYQQYRRPEGGNWRGQQSERNFGRYQNTSRENQSRNTQGNFRNVFQ